MDSGASSWRAIAMGAAIGLRMGMGPLVLSRAASRGGLPGMRKTPFAFLSSRWIANLLALFALGELVVDKLPFIPDRTERGSAFGRLVSGAVCGAALRAATGRNAWTGVALGGVAALATAHAGERYRRQGTEAGAPDPALALLEDAASAGLALLALRGL